MFTQLEQGTGYRRRNKGDCHWMDLEAGVMEYSESLGDLALPLSPQALAGLKVRLLDLPLFLSPS